jgi:hypothetical protein
MGVTPKQDGDPGDPLSVGDSGVKIGPRINGFQYAAMTAGVIYGLAENVVKDILEIGKTVGKESQRLKDVEDLEFLDIDKTEQKSDSPGLTLPSWEEIGAGLKRNIQETNQAVTTAKEQGEYFATGRAISNDPMLQVTGLGDLAVFGTLAKMQKVAKLDSLGIESPNNLGEKVHPEVEGDGKLSNNGENKASEAGVGGGASAVEDAAVRLEVIPPNKVSTIIRGSVDHPHEAIQAMRFGDLYGGGVIDFGNVTPGIEGYFIKQGTDIKTPFSLKNLSGAGNVKNIFREIKSNARVIQKHESLPQSDAMSLPVGTSQNAVIHVNCPQFSAQEIISFIRGSKPNIFQLNVFKEILIDTNSGVVVIDAAKKASLRK